MSKTPTTERRFGVRRKFSFGRIRIDRRSSEERRTDVAAEASDGTGDERRSGRDRRSGEQRRSAQRRNTTLKDS